MHLILALDVLALLWLSTQPAPLADPPPSWLRAEWAGTAACVDAGSVPERVEQMLGEATPPPTHVRLRAEPAGDAWDVILDLEVEGPAISRTLRGRDCETLTEAVALVVAVHADPLSVAAHVEAVRTEASTSRVPEPSSETEIVAPPRPTGPPRAERQAEASRPAPRRPPPRERTSRREPPARPRASLGATVAAELGALPTAGASFELGAGLLWPHAQAEIAGLMSIGPSATAPELDTVGGRFRLYAGIARGCGVLGGGRFEVPLCGALELGDLRGRGQGPGLERPETVDGLWVALSLGARPRWVLHPRVALGAVADLIVPLRRHRFAVPNVGVVHEVAPIGARLGLSLQVRLP